MAVWKDKDPDEIPESGDFQDWRVDLQNATSEWTIPRLNEAVGQQVNGRTWAQISEELNDYCKGLVP